MFKRGLGRATGEDPAWFRRGHTLPTGKGLWGLKAALSHSVKKPILTASPWPKQEVLQV